MIAYRFLFDRRFPRMRRRILAALLAPPLAMIVYGSMAPLWFGPGSPSQVLGMTAMMAGIGSLFAYGGMLVVGVPANLMLSSLGAERGIAYLAIGAASLPVALTLSDGSLPTIGQFTLAAAPGSLVAGILWFIASRK
jgi:hypothetical protein